MSQITVIGGTGYAGSAIVAEAAARGHQVTSFSRALPPELIPGIDYVRGDVADTAALATAISDTDVIVGALAPRGALAGTFRDVYGRIAHQANAQGVPLFIVGGFSSLRRAPGGPRFVEDPSHAPAEIYNEILTVAALVTDDLPTTPETLNWIYVSPPARFGAHVPGERLGRYRIGNDVAIQPDDGGAISAPDYAIGILDLIENANHHRTHLNLAY